jgi:hypothetical protein
MAGSLTRKTRSLLVGCTAMLASLVIAPAALADCPGQVLEQPFQPWDDAAHYTLLPDGDLSAGAAGWALDGAEVVDDNEPWFVHGAAAPAALRLGAGDRATTPPICVTPDHPTMRFFARNAGGGGALLVEVVLDDRRAFPIGAVTTEDGAWAPSPVIPIVANRWDDEVAFRFTAIGGGSEWLVDDVYVDPYKKG